MRRLITTAVIAIALVCSFVAGAVIQGDIMPAQAASFAPASATITGKVPAPWLGPDAFIIKYSDGTTYEFTDMKQVEQWCLEMQTKENAERLALARWLALDDDLSNTSVMVGKKLVFDLSANSPIKVQ